MYLCETQAMGLGTVLKYEICEAGESKSKLGDFSSSSLATLNYLTEDRCNCVGQNLTEYMCHLIWDVSSEGADNKLSFFK